jgi:hypothetical protein
MGAYGFLYEDPENTVKNIENGFEAISRMLSEESREDTLEDHVKQYKAMWENLGKIEDYIKDKHGIEGLYFVPGRQNGCLDSLAAEDKVPCILGDIYDIKEEATDTAEQLNAMMGSKELGSDYMLITGGLALKEDFEDDD